jgi:hypothetical protein
MSALAQRDPPPDDDDGFGGSPNTTRLGGGNFLKWTKEAGWRDRDGIEAPSPMLVLAVGELLVRWQGNKPEYIREKPLPDPKVLNEAIPKSQWEKGIDGKLREPWAHNVAAIFVNPKTGVLYKWNAPTTGAHIAIEALTEAVVTMRALRGAKVMPLVTLGARPMKTNFGMSSRPHFEIIGWKSPGGDASQVEAKPATPQLSGPASADAPAPTPKPKPAVNTVNETTLDTMKDIEPATTAEIMDDDVPW